MYIVRRASTVLATIVVAALTANASAQTASSIPSYYDHNRFNLTSPSAQTTPSGGFTNPAGYGWLDGFSGQFGWSNTLDRIDKAEQWGLFTGFSHVGFGMIENRTVALNNGTGEVQDMRVALIDHHWSTTVGLAYGWSSGADESLGRSDIVQVGVMHQVGRWMRFGAVGNFAVDSPDRTGLLDLAIRPLGRWLTLFGDTELRRAVSATDSPWSAGVLFEGIRAIQLSGRYFSDESIAFAVSLNFYGLWLTGSPGYNQDRNRTSTTYDVRF